VPVIDKSQRQDGTFSREDFIYDEARDIYTCPAGKTLTTTGHVSTDHSLQYLGSVPECRACLLKAKCCPKMPSRRVKRDVHEAARDVARTHAKTPAFAQSRLNACPVRERYRFTVLDFCCVLAIRNAKRLGT